MIETGQTGINANVQLCIYGDKLTTNQVALRTDSKRQFLADSRLEFDVRDVDVGQVKH
jgi:hypothetical protein